MSTVGRNDCIRVMLIDDSLTVRTAFSRMLEKEDDIAVTATAASAEIAISHLRQVEVDVFLLDLEMPGMGGLKALPVLLEKASSAEILVVSSLTDEGAKHTLAALSMGAADTMLKPRPGGYDEDYRKNLVAKIRALGGRENVDNTVFEPPRASSPNIGKCPEIVAIGASTGGIHALNQLMKSLPRGFDLPILVTQHLPSSFMPVFARQLEISAARQTLIASEGLTIRRGTVVVAPGHGHLLVRKDGERYQCALSYEPALSGCMPSVDPMLTSLAEACNGAALGVILSGMGRDGSLGARSLVEAGGTVFAQDAETSAVWGMPRGVIEAGDATLVGPPEHLAAKTIELAGAASWT